MEVVVSHKEHCMRTKLRLGKSYADVHRYMDQPYAFLKGRHRILRHDVFTALEVTVRKRDPKAFLAAIFHLVDDGEI